MHIIPWQILHKKRYNNQESLTCPKSFSHLALHINGEMKWSVSQEFEIKSVFCSMNINEKNVHFTPRAGMKNCFFSLKTRTKKIKIKGSHFLPGHMMTEATPIFKKMICRSLSFIIQVCQSLNIFNLYASDLRFFLLLESLLKWCFGLRRKLDIKENVTRLLIVILNIS